VLSPFLLGMLDLEDKGTIILKTLETPHPTTKHHIPEDLNPQFSGCYVLTAVEHGEFNKCSTRI
jgi:hypothetical protein